MSNCPQTMIEPFDQEGLKFFTQNGSHVNGMLDFGYLSGPKWVFEKPKYIANVFPSLRQISFHSLCEARWPQAF
jgi:hypothetical protein